MINEEIGATNPVRLVPMTLVIRKLFAVLEANGIVTAQDRAALFQAVEGELRDPDYEMLAALADLAPR